MTEEEQVEWLDSMIKEIVENILFCELEDVKLNEFRRLRMKKLGRTAHVKYYVITTISKETPKNDFWMIACLHEWLTVR